MRLLLESPDRAMLLERAALLESRGIPTHVDDVPHAGAVPSHLHILLDEQWEDAVAVLENADHPVARPVYGEERESALGERARVESMLRDQILQRMLFGILGLMGLFFVIEQIAR